MSDEQSEKAIRRAKAIEALTKVNELLVKSEAALDSRQANGEDVEAMFNVIILMMDAFGASGLCATPAKDVMLIWFECAKMFLSMGGRVAFIEPKE
ncbi:hypothetical protein [Nitrospira sp. BLG_1]|uniref:hypothetical protein n=1 Tax=Nitrospira sp. BLG_1 TaxID=3395883 RepID=UPI0039BD134D